MSNIIRSDDIYISPLVGEERVGDFIYPSNLEDYRYCEVMPVWENGSELITEAYNTITCSDCPSIEWLEVMRYVEEDLITIYGAKEVIFNGPRHWVMDEIVPDYPLHYDKVVTFEGLQMALVAQIPGDTFGKYPYQDEEIRRWNTYNWKKGQKTYVLINHNNDDMYIMQSYSKMKDKTLSLEDLPNLNERLVNLPPGWEYKYRGILDEDYSLVTEGLALVIHDELGNGYQKMVQ